MKYLIFGAHMGSQLSVNQTHGHLDEISTGQSKRMRISHDAHAP